MSSTISGNNDIPSLKNKVAIVTGANTGLGYQTAKSFALQQAHVVMACRDEGKALDAMNAIKAEYDDAKMTFIALDLANLKTIKTFAKQFNETFQRLDILVNNAGVMAIPACKTKDGFEHQFGVNHLGHFALTGLLLAPLKATPHSRVISVSSLNEASSRINFNDLMGEKRYNRWLAYGQSKLANLLFAYELDRQLKKHGYKTISLAAHPGMADTNLQQVGPQMDKSLFASQTWKYINRVFAQTADQGALPQIYASTAQDVKGGEYYGPNDWFGMRGKRIKSIKSSTKSYDRDMARQLWNASEALTGIAYNF